VTAEPSDLEVWYETPGDLPYPEPTRLTPILTMPTVTVTSPPWVRWRWTR
jgi:hypothetical protein